MKVYFDCDSIRCIGKADGFSDFRIYGSDLRMTTDEPTAQPTETCKWTLAKVTDGVINPHDESWWANHRGMTCCPTCGKRIEVVE